MSVNSLTLLVEADGGIAASHFYGSRKFRPQMLWEFPQAVRESSDPQRRTRVSAQRPQVRLRLFVCPTSNGASRPRSVISAENRALRTDILFVLPFLMKSLKGSRGRRDGPGSGDVAVDKGSALQWDCQVSARRWGDKRRRRGGLERHMTLRQTRRMIFD